MMGWGWSGAWGWWGVLTMLAMWAIPLGLIFLGIWAVAPRFGAGGRSSALEIAEARYARGEISREEFQRIKEDLRR